MRKVALLSLMVFALTGCSNVGADESGGLQDRTGAFARAMSDERWQDAYEFLAPEARQACPVEEFVGGLTLSIGFYLALAGAKENEHYEWRATVIDEQEDTGVVFFQAFFNDELEISRDNPNEWRRIAGEWLMVGEFAGDWWMIGQSMDDGIRGTPGCD